MKEKNKKVVVGLSGGIDSSMALVLLKQQGWDVIGVSLKMPVWSFDKAQDKHFKNAEKVCQKLKVPFYLVDVEKDFQKKVVDYFVKEFSQGNTPNPCIICNPRLKFKTLLDFARKKSIKYVATGHYARKREIKNEKLPARNAFSITDAGGKIKNYQLLKAKDKNKDQTYNLCFLTQNQLRQIIFPLGSLTKKEVFQLAKKQGFDFLINKKQSQDFCYCPSKKIPDFLKQIIGKKPGRIIDIKGKTLGQHQGLHFYTLGQRKRIGLSGGPYFVKGFDKKKNLLIITKNEKDLLQKELCLSPFNFISGQAPKRKIKVIAKIRYRHPENKATLFPPRGGKLKLVFDKPQRAITPGQFAVFYLPRGKAGKGKVCLGGGKILGSS